jgi:hypothetical protein
MQKVGLLLVHGIGEQRRFEHLSNEVRQLVLALQDKVGDEKRVSVQARTSRDGAYGAEHETWLAERDAPIRIDVHDNTRHVQICVHEVWWADLDEQTTLRSQVRFWLWGLSLWLVKRFDKSKLPGANLHMRLPELPTLLPSWIVMAWTRVRLYGVATVFLLVLLSLSLANFILSRFLAGRIPGPDILVSYIGDVKLYQQRGRAAAGPIADMNQPPRVAIRRRMIRTMVDAALADYDRWYILAHSLGTILAWNGVMESAHCLPNYLDRARWERCIGAGLGQVHPDGAPGPVGEMRPPRPNWLNNADVINRAKLFQRLEGLLTYGSPLDKFAFLWPSIVALNKDEAVFQPSFEWINVYDNTDPVAASLEAFAPKEKSARGKAVAKPQNFAFRAYPLLLLSHIRYLAFKKHRSGRLVNRVGDWLLHGGRFPKPKLGSEGWLTPSGERFRATWRIAQWGVVAVVLSAIVALWLEPAIQKLWHSLPGVDAVTVARQSASDSVLQWLIREVPQHIAGAAVVVFTVGVLGRIRENWMIGGNEKEQVKVRK